MLGPCKTLLECEELLRGRVKEVRYLGELDLNELDHAKLCNLVKDLKGNLKEKTDYLLEHAPTTFVYYLLCMGIFEYKGDYWSPVRRHMNGLDRSWRSRWGKAFWDFLFENNLPRIDNVQKNRFAENILYHGGIPLSCMNEFIENIALPQAFTKMTPEKVKENLKNKREQNLQREKVKIEIEALEQEKRKWEQELDRLYWIKEKSAKTHPGNSTIPQQEKGDRDNQDQLYLQVDKIKNDLKAARDKKRQLQEKLEQYRDREDNHQESNMELYSDMAMEEEENVYSSEAEEDKDKPLTEQIHELKRAQQDCKNELARLLVDLKQTAKTRCNVAFLFGDIPWSLLVEKFKDYFYRKRSLQDLRIKKEEMESMRFNPGFAFWAGGVLILTGAAINVMYHLPPFCLLITVTGGVLLLLNFRRFLRELSAGREKKMRIKELSRQILDEKNLLAEMENNLIEISRDFPRPTALLSLEIEDFPALERLLKLTQKHQYLKNKKEMKIKYRERAGLAAVKHGGEGAPEVESSVIKETAAEEKNQNIMRQNELEEDARNIKQQIERIEEEEEKLKQMYLKYKEEAAASSTQGKEQEVTNPENMTTLPEKKESIATLLDDYLEDVRTRLQLEPGDVENVENLEEKLNHLIELHDRKIKERQKDLRSFSPVYTDTDEAVRRFVLYGDEWAEEWVAGVVEMIKSLLDKGGISDPDQEVELPQRVADSIMSWWKS